jgi:hypothetical protein
VRRFGLIVWRTFALMVLVVGLAFTALAAIGWLQTAHWKPLTVGEALSTLPAVREWLAHPRSWIGLHRIVSWLLRVPLFLLLTVIGVGLAAMSAPKQPREIWQPWSGR